MSPRGPSRDKPKPSKVVDRQGAKRGRYLPPDQYERLIMIIRLLLPQYRVHHVELARDLKVCSRTLQRDIKALRDREIFIHQERGGYYLPVYKQR